MSRGLTAAMLAEITAAALRPVIFYEGEFSGGTLRLWSGLGSKDWNGQIWSGAGDLMSVSEIEETAEIRASGITVALSGLKPNVISAALAQARQGLAGKVWLGMLAREAYIDLPGTSGNYASSPDSAAASLTGDMDIRVRAALDDWTPAGAAALFAKSVATGSQISFFLRVATDGTLQLIFSPDGTAGSIVVKSSTVATGAAAGSSLWVKVTLDVDNGAGGYDAKFYTSTDGVTWTQLGSTVTTATPTSVYDGTAPLEIGSSNAGTGNLAVGKVYYAELRNGIDGTVVAKFDPATDARRADKSFTSSETGEIWTINQSGDPHAEIMVDDGAVVADPFLAFEGRLDVPDITDNGDTCTVRINYESRLIDLERPRERRITHEDQQNDYPGDLGRQYVAVIQDKVVAW